MGTKCRVVSRRDVTSQVEFGYYCQPRTLPMAAGMCATQAGRLYRCIRGGPKKVNPNRIINIIKACQRDAGDQSFSVKLKCKRHQRFLLRQFCFSSPMKYEIQSYTIDRQSAGKFMFKILTHIFLFFWRFHFIVYSTFHPHRSFKHSN